MDWMVCVQLPNDIIKYVHSSNPEYPSFIGYQRFVQNYTEPLQLLKNIEFIEELNKFQQIFIDIEKHEWNVIPFSRDEDYSFDELYEINKPVEKEEMSKIEKTKEYILDKVKGK